MVGEQKVTLSALKLRGIRVLLESRNITVAAKRLGVSRKTIYEWLGEDEFREALNLAKVRVMDNAETSLLAGMDLALNRLERLMVGSLDEYTQLRACKVWLDMVLKFRDSGELIKRVEALEVQNEKYKRQD